MEFVILVFPLLEVYESKKRKEKVAHDPHRSEACKYSMAALERALRDDIERLEQFAAEKDFSGENIIFLKRIENWKDRWNSASAHSPNGQLPANVAQSLFDTAQQIFHDCISYETSPFPVNIDESIYLDLAKMFAPKSTTNYNKFSARAMIAPFADDEKCPDRTTFRNIPLCDTPSDDERPPTPPRKNSLPFPYASVATREATAKAAALLWGRRVREPLPVGFDKSVFDEAESTVKQMVLENTWVRFVDSTPEILGAREAREADLEGLKMKGRAYSSSSEGSWGSRWGVKFWK